MRSATSLEGSLLVRIAVPCAQTRVAIEMPYSALAQLAAFGRPLCSCTVYSG